MKSIIWRALLALAATGACACSLTAAAQTENGDFAATKSGRQLDSPGHATKLRDRSPVG